MGFKTGKHRSVAVIAAALLVQAAGVAMATEEPAYEVVSSHGDVEIRRYQPMILAETRVDSQFEEAGNEAFRRLFGYISGNNTTRSKIAMTAPVVQEADASGWRVAFVVPSEFSWETTPQPTDSRVELRLVPERTMAVLRFSGTWGEARFAEHERKLRAVVEELGLRVVGEAVYARYNPPFTPWFMRRNEVMIPVARVDNGD
jgi:hypothetical protein